MLGRNKLREGQVRSVHLLPPQGSNLCGLHLWAPRGVSRAFLSDLMMGRPSRGVIRRTSFFWLLPVELQVGRGCSLL